MPFEIRALPYETPPKDRESHLCSKAPWCSGMFQDARYQPFTTRNRIPKAKNSEDKLVAVTLGTEKTIRAWQSFYKPPDLGQDGPGEFYDVLSLGDGVDGHAGIAHGGFISLVCDEVMSGVAHFHREKETHGVTAFMHVDYKKLIPTPSVILCRGKLDTEKSGGKKYFVHCSIEDGQGAVFASAHCLVISLKDDPARL